MHFGCNACEADGWYGVTLTAALDDSDVICYRSVFRGERGRNPKEVIAIFTHSHLDVMKRVGFNDELPEEKLHKLIAKSVEMAASGMEQWGLSPIEFSKVPEWILFFLFAERSEAIYLH